MIEEQKKASDLRKFISEAYNQIGSDQVDLKSLNDTEIMELADNLKGGLPFATPAFDGATEQEIKGMLRIAGLPESGQAVLYDGRTGRNLIARSLSDTCTC